jgi:predicted metal-binding transcription factor (methanogenesis marker protein 9)
LVFDSLGIDRRATLLLEFVEKEKRCPKSAEEYQGFTLGKFWRCIKYGHNTFIYDTVLSKNIILKEEYDRFQEQQEENKDKETLSPEKKTSLLLEFVDKVNRCPKVAEEYQECNVGSFWRCIKYGANKQIYDTILSKHQILKEEYERFQKQREENKDKETLSPKEKATLLLEFVEKYLRYPKDKEEYQEVKLGIFWSGIKYGTNKEIYDTILSKHQILKEEYERFQKHKK